MNTQTHDQALALLRKIHAELDEGDGEAPGHGHQRPGVWDSDNGELAGKPCKWCATWREVTALVRANP